MPRRRAPVLPARAQRAPALCTLLFSAIALAGCVTPVMRNADTMEPQRMLSGSVMDKAACDAANDAWPDAGTVWVVLDPGWDPEDGTCIRYVTAGLAPANPMVAMYFHGDVMWQSLDGRSGWFSSYEKVSPEKLREFAERENATFARPYIRVSRPGTYGSSGFHKKRRRAREAEILDAAIDAIKERHAITRLSVAGQSGGGHMVASLLTRRDDIACAAISSGVVSITQRARHHGWDRDITGYRDYYDPIEHVSEIRPDPDRRLFVIGDPRDTNVPFFTQEAYARAVEEAGHDVTLVRTEASGRSHHSLALAGFKVLRWCMDGVPAQEIQARLPLPPAE